MQFIQKISPALDPGSDLVQWTGSLTSPSHIWSHKAHNDVNGNMTRLSALAFLISSKAIQGDATTRSRAI